MRKTDKCPVCGGPLEQPAGVCQKCGMPAIQDEEVDRLLAEDPMLRSLNERYAGYGKKLAASLISMAICFFVFTLFIDGSLGPWAFAVGLFGFLAGTVATVWFFAKRKKLGHELHELIADKALADL